MLTVKCRAETPATCRYHGQSLTKLEKQLNKTKDMNSYLKIRDLINQHKIAAYLENLPGTKLTTPYTNENLTVEIHESKPSKTDNSTWTNLFISDENGEAIGHIKVHYHPETETTPAIVALCNVETNPKFKGQTISLAMFRKLKEHYNVQSLQAGDTFSEQGLQMFQRLRKHELLTGEKTIELDDYVKPKEHELNGYGKYTFVNSWEEKQPKYLL